MGLPQVLPHSRGSRTSDRQPVHFESMGKCVLVATCAYTAAHLICYPLGVYKNMK